MPAKISQRTPGEKLLALYTFFIFKGRRYSTLSELAENLSCSKQTVLRLLSQLEASGYGKLEPPVRRGRQDCYRMAPAPERELDLGVGELARLAACRNILVSVLPNSIGKLLTEESSGDDGVGTVYTKGRIDYEPFQELYALLTRALRQKRVCLVSYRKSPALPPREIAFAPTRLVTYHETISFVGWEVEDDDPVRAKFLKPLTLHLQRCLAVSLTGRESGNLSQTDAAREDNRGAFGFMRGDPFEVTVLFEAPAVAYVHDRKWSEDQKIKLRDDGRLELTVTARSKPEIVSWILSFGARARALSPQWLRDEIREQARLLSESYADVPGSEKS